MQRSKCWTYIAQQCCCGDIIEHIACSMRQKLIKHIVDTKPTISVMVDESTSLSQKSLLIVYLRCSVDCVSDPISFFLDIVELESGSAETVFEALLNCLYMNDLDDTFLEHCWLGLGTDGASVMLGKKAGLVAKVQEQFPRVIGWHCCNHRLELAVGDAVKSCSEVNNFKIFMDKLYCTYSMSNKNRRALESCASAVGVELNKIGKMLDTRWVSSSFRAVNAVWTDFAALYKHFSDASVDHSLDSKERAGFAGLAKKLSSPAFVLNLGLMCDALQELADLSQSLQSDSINLQKAHRLILREIDVMKGRKGEDSAGDRYSVAKKAVEVGELFNVKLGTGSQRDVIINKNQFYQSLCDSLYARLLTDADSSVIQDLNIAFPQPWPGPVPPEYGETELKRICLKFLVLDNNAVKDSYRSYKESCGKEVDVHMKKLLCSVSTLPVSTAVCERGFSRMNIVCSPLRNCLTTAHLASLLFISMVGPPLNEWDPVPAVKAWLAKGRRHANYTGCASQSNDKEVASARAVYMKPAWKIIQ